jgi:hydrogenase nickel incorporation protein HypA/HybF
MRSLTICRIEELLIWSSVAMHEMSIAQAILNLAQEHVPPGSELRVVRMRAGPMRAIEPQSMQWAWEALVSAPASENVSLELTTSPWRMRCNCCGHEWEGDSLADRCTCGSRDVRPIGGDELQLISIEVDDRSEL